MKVRLTGHAVDRFIERIDYDVSKSEAIATIMKSINPQKEKIKEGLMILRDVRVKIVEDLIAVCINDSLDESDIVVVTVRKSKERNR